MKVGPEVEEIPRRDLARHHRGGGTALLGGVDHAAKLADAHPMDLVHESRQRRIGLPLEGGGFDPIHARLAGPFHCKERVGAVAGDQEECLGLLHDPQRLPVNGAIRQLEKHLSERDGGDP